ncbi:MAG: hypothetical protein CMC82_09850 [Flavobacteriaceae bacterium]|nr:hypothetical protein [Flavobacteriaceae bacterium]
MNNRGLQKTLPLALMDDHMSGELLRRAIEKRGIKKKHVAQKKGIEQGTLSRQMAGKHSLTLKDLREYADILDCEFEELIIDIQPMEIIGKHHDGTIYVDDVTSKIEQIVPPMTLPASYKGIWEDRGPMNNTLHVFNGNYILNEGIIDQTCYTQLCAYKITQSELTRLNKLNDSWTNAINMGFIYPEPSGKFTIGSAVTAGRQRPGVDLVWAAPIIASFHSPLTLGWQLK